MKGQELVVVEPPVALAQEIRAEIEAADADWNSALAHAIAAGELLIEAKAQCRHGKWLPWLEAQCDLSERSAQGYMRVARNPQRVADLGADSLREALKSLTKPSRNGKTPQSSEPISGKPDIHVRAITDWTPPTPVDYVVTDPPYEQSALPLYSELSAFAARALCDGGSLVCMVGQSYLPEVLQRLSEHLTYHWMAAYLTPGGQAVQLWDRNVNTFWKPLLWFTKGDYAGNWIGDVTRSAVNDNDKTHHDWGQSESGMADVVERFTQPGDLIADPFLGGGTTAVVSLALGRRFVGADSDPKAIETTMARFR